MSTSRQPNRRTQRASQSGRAADGGANQEPDGRTNQEPDGRDYFGPSDPAVISNDLGQQIRAIRHAQKLTLEAISHRSGLSIGALSQVERGKGNPAFFTLIKIAHALDVPLTSLLQIDSGVSPVVRARERRPLTPHFFKFDGVKSELLTPDLDRQLQVCRYELPPGATTKDAPFMHAGEEFLTVLTGTCAVGLGDVTYQLQAGDSVAYDAANPHWFANAGSTVAEILFACTPPTF